MRSSWVLTTICVVVFSLAPAAPVAADVLAVEDPAGDGLKGQRLDITTVELSNRDHAIVTDVSFVRAAAGDLAIFLHARGTTRKDTLLIVSDHRPKRGDQTFIGTAHGPQVCKGLRVTWDHDAETARVRLPSACFHGGDYGAVRTRIITEIGSDADLAPEAPVGTDGDMKWAWSTWTDRG